MKLILCGNAPARIEYLSKIFFLMRFTVFFMLLGMLQLSASGYSQQVHYTGKHVRIEKVLKSIAQQTGYNLFYRYNELREARPVDVELKGVSLQKALAELFKGQPFEYMLREQTIIINRKKETMEPPPATEDVQVMIDPVKGVVRDEGGQPLAGASVSIKNSGAGTATDAGGRFSVTPETQRVTLIISYTGYETREITAAAGADLAITLKTVQSSMNEIVVVGYGTQRRELVTSAIGRFKVKDEDVRQVASPTRLLEGRVAGVNVSVGSGNLASGEKISVRGFSSISAGNNPLYVVDGVPINTANMSLYDFGETYSPLAALNHADIESIEVLKDAASAAIYGSRASNGVILITTKSGKKGVNNIRMDLSTGFSEFANRKKVKIAGSDLYVLQFNQGQENYNKQYGLSVGDANYKMPISNPFGDMPDTDWLGLVLQKGYFKNLNTSFSGGTEQTKYYVGFGATDQEGVFKNNSIRKYNINTKLTHKFNNWLELGANNMGTYIRNNQIPGANAGTTVIGRTIGQRPFDRPFKPNGDYYIGGTDELVYHNPVQILNEQVAYVDNLRYLGTFYGNIFFNEYLSFKSSFSADINYTYDYTYFNANHPYGTGVGRLIDYNRLIQNSLVENTLNYQQTFNRLEINGMAGHSFQSQHLRNTSVDARGFPTPSLVTVSVASEIFGAGGAVSEYALESYFGRGTVALDDKYMMTATVRMDGSSKFHPRNRWGLFPSVSFGWNVAKEPFLKDAGLDLKLRASYGKTGNQEGIGSYAYQALMSGGQNYGNESGISVSSFGNEDLTWEKADQYDVGFDLSLFNHKLDVSFDAYYKKTTDLLYSMPIHATTGMTSIITNIGSMDNRGLELSVSSDFNLGRVKWNTNFNIARNRNKILSLIDNGNLPISIGDNRALQVGWDIGSFYLFQMEGIYQYDGEVPQEQFDLGARAGDVKWKDVDGNHIINDNDRVVVGSSNPKFSGGWNNTFSYKGLQLDVLTTFMYGNNVYNQSKPSALARIGYRTAQLEEYIVNQWTGPGSTNVYPRAIAGEIFNTRNSTRFLEDGSFIRIRAATLGYQVPSFKIKRFNVKGIRVYAQVDNLFLWTRYSGWDPEVSKDLDPRFFGTDWFNNPQPRTYSLGVNINL